MHTSDQGCLKHSRLFDWRTGQWASVDKSQLEALQQIFAHLDTIINVEPIPCDLCLAEIAGRRCARCRGQIAETRYVVDDDFLYHIQCWSSALDQFNEAQGKILDALALRHREGFWKRLYRYTRRALDRTGTDT